MARLCSRTAMSAAGLSISATEASEPGFAKGSRSLLPSLGTDPELLGEQSDEDPRLVLAEAGQRLHSLEQLVARRGSLSRPRLRFRRNPATSKRQSSCTRAAMEPGKRWSAGRSTNRAVSSSGFMAAISAASSSLPSLWRSTQGPAESLLERHLLVEDHADQKGEGIVDEVLVCLGVPGERKALGSLQVLAASKKCTAAVFGSCRLASPGGGCGWAH